MPHIRITPNQMINAFFFSQMCVGSCGFTFVTHTHVELGLALCKDPQLPSDLISVGIRDPWDSPALHPLDFNGARDDEKWRGIVPRVSG
jgi:hypothetical protein